MRSIKSECLDRMISFGEEPFPRAVAEYLAHYHTERNHQGLDNTIIAPVPGPARPFGRVRCRERPRGMLRYYHRRAVWQASGVAGTVLDDGQDFRCNARGRRAALTATVGRASTRS